MRGGAHRARQMTLSDRTGISSTPNPYNEFDITSHTPYHIIPKSYLKRVTHSNNSVRKIVFLNSLFVVYVVKNSG